MAKKKPTPSPKPAGPSRARTSIDTIKHTASRRKNIPTEELRDFVSDDENAPRAMLYPRDPSLDPQLVWKGKDEQDREALAVPAVPIYIQEKIHPQVIVADFVSSAQKAGGAAEQQPGLFADFNGIEGAGGIGFDKKLDFYHHDQHWTNRMILGDSLLAMTSLAEKEGLKGKVQTIYFDPPYGIKFGSNWQVSTRKRDVKDGKAEDMTRQPEQIKAFRDTYKLGIHSYLPYLRDRLTVARELLTESGSIFLQIGDANVHLVRSVLDEVFGAENFVAQITFAKTSGSTREFIGGTCDFLLFYAKAKDNLKFRTPYVEKSVESEIGGPYSMLLLPDGKRRRMTADEKANPKMISAGARVYRIDNLQSQSMGREKGEGASCWFPVTLEGKKYLPSDKSRWKTNEPGMTKLLAARRLEATSGGLYYVRFINDFPAMPISDLWADTVVAGFASDKRYVVETSVKVVERCIMMTTDPGDLVLDPTCGSGTTAYVAEQWGRRWITTDTSRVALALARTRLMCARFPYYLLSDSPEGRKKEAELSASVPSVSSVVNPSAAFDGDVRKGFVYQRVPHVTLKSIANNPDIKEGMTRREIDAAIAKHADTETLFDKPYADAGRLRVAGPFTVESLSPHRTISVEAKERAANKPTDLGFTMKMLAGSDFTNTMLENLKKAGVQNTVKSQRLKFDSVEIYPGEWICGEGRYADADGKPRRAAICIGPEFGTVEPRLVKDAAMETVKGVGFDILLVCGFAFDPHVAEEAKRYGKLTVLSVKMNPDLSMGDELLKKTGAGNLFMVFGEPDVAILSGDKPAGAAAAKGKKPAADAGAVRYDPDVPEGMLVAEIRGLDVYDPTTGEIRSNSTDDIACWFIDTNYNDESFFVRHAYFTGADEPYEKLKKALRAEVDESAWADLYQTRSRPFPRPASGKIAVKVINHYGDEVLKVYAVGK